MFYERVSGLTSGTRCVTRVITNTVKSLIPLKSVGDVQAGEEGKCGNILSSQTNAKVSLF